MSDIGHLLVLSLELYLVLGIMAIGFGYMIAGKNGGKRVARWYFANLLRWVWWRVRGLVGVLLSLVWSVPMFRIVRPLLYRLGRGVRWLLTRDRGWARPS
jgi:hypothetical protein